MTQPTIVFSPLHAGVPAAGGALEVLVRVFMGTQQQAGRHIRLIRCADLS